MILDAADTIRDGCEGCGGENCLRAKWFPAYRFKPLRGIGGQATEFPA
jgi:hypothetical protein